jgi:DNA (cytosine-5)-methyltransferase 1
LFCGGGGCSAGYVNAGFEVVGVDIEPHPNYPFEFVQNDAIDLMVTDSWRCWGGPRGFDAIHASPPCQAYSTATRDHSAHPDLYAATRELLEATGLPYVIENVVGAPYSHGIVLCGSMFGMEVRRHRNFETSWLMFQPDHPCKFETRPYTITGHRNGPNGHESAHSKGPSPEEGPKLMGCPWMTWEECVLAIPPAYTEFIGTQLMANLKVKS